MYSGLSLFMFQSTSTYEHAHALSHVRTLARLISDRLPSMKSTGVDSGAD